MFKTSKVRFLWMPQHGSLQFQNWQVVGKQNALLQRLYARVVSIDWRKFDTQIAKNTIQTKKDKVKGENYGSKIKQSHF